MLVSLLAGLAPTLGGEGDEEKDGRGGVVLRREQVKRVLFEGKAGIVEHDAIIGLLFPRQVSLSVDVNIQQTKIMPC
jgi:hypothetical protein